MQIKADIEIYMGLYLIAVWFIRRSHIFSIMIYWQLLRIRYMIGGLTTQAFIRLDGKLQNGI
jgi:Transmembrane protein 33/Nucleoporin POM33